MKNLLLLFTLLILFASCDKTEAPPINFESYNEDILTITENGYYVTIKANYAGKRWKFKNMYISSINKNDSLIEYYMRYSYINENSYSGVTVKMYANSFTNGWTIHTVRIFDEDGVNIENIFTN